MKNICSGLTLNGLRGHVTIEDVRSGRILLDGSNIITNVGKEIVAKMLGGSLSGVTVPSIQKMAISNGGVDTPATGGIAIAPPPTTNSLENTILTDESIDTVAVNLVPATKEITYISTFNSADVVDFGAPTYAADKVSEVGLITSDNLLFAVKRFDSLDFDPAVPDVLQFTWTIFVP